MQPANVARADRSPRATSTHAGPGALDCDLLSGLEPTDRQTLLEHFERVTSKSGAPLFDEEGPGDELYLLLEGAVRIRTSPKTAWDDEATTHVRVVQPGETFGEIGFCDGRPRLASAHAHEDSELLRLSRSAYRRLAQDRPGLALAFMNNVGQILAGRLRDTSLLWLSAR